MLDDQDDSRSAHSIGIVENPLYAEQEEYNTPSYAALKEKEVRISGVTRVVIGFLFPCYQKIYFVTHQTSTYFQIEKATPAISCSKTTVSVASSRGHLLY